MDAQTVNRESYAHTKGERFEARRPQDSNVLKGEGPIDAESVNRAEYRAKVADRSPGRRPGTSDLWKVLSLHSAKSIRSSRPKAPWTVSR